MVERGEQVAVRDAGAFVKENAGDAPGYLGGNGGAAARGNVPAGIQRRLGPAGIRLGRGRDLHDGLLAPQSKSGGDNGSKNDNRKGGVNNPLARARLAALAIMHAEGAKVSF